MAVVTGLSAGSIQEHTLTLTVGTQLDSGSDLTVHATTNTDVLPDAHTPAAGDVGKVVSITSGTGFTTGYYQVMSIQSGYWRLDRSPAAVETAGGVWTLHDPQRTEALKTNGFRPLLVICPAAWTTSKLGWETSRDGTTWTGIAKQQDGSTVIVLGSAASAIVACQREYPVYREYIRLFPCDASGNFTVQAADRALIVVMGKG